MLLLIVLARGPDFPEHVHAACQALGPRGGIACVQEKPRRVRLVAHWHVDDGVDGQMRQCVASHCWKKALRALYTRHTDE